MLEAPHHPPQAEQLGRERQAEQQRRYWRGQRDGVMLIAVAKRP